MEKANGGEMLFLRNRDCDDQKAMEEMWDDTALIRAYDKAISDVHKKLNIPDSKAKGKQKSKTRKPGNSWKVGDSCISEFSEDGYYYEALITSIDYSRGKCVVKFTDYGNEEEHDVNELLDLDAIVPERGISDDLDHSTVSSVGRLSVNDSTTGNSKGDKGRTKKKKKRSAQSLGYPQATNAFTHSEYLMRFPQHNNHASSQRYGTPLDNFCTNQPFSKGLPPPGTGNQFRMPPLPPGLKSNSDDPALNSMLMAWYMCGYHSGYYQGLNDGKSGNM